jgi:hypothetical protein
MPPPAPGASACYVNLRYEGYPPPRARAELGLSEGPAAKLERLFLTRCAEGRSAMRPKFARHAKHVAAVRAAGGFPVLRRP